MEALSYGALGSGTCDLSRMRLAGPADLLTLNDIGLNVLLFVPLGVVLGLTRRSRYGAAAIVAAVALPFAIETIQLLVLPLDRACQSGDVIDNLTGLLIGLATAVLAQAIVSAVARFPGSRGDRRPS